MINLTLPPQVSEVLERLNEHYYKAYIVGKCVRELLMEHDVMDYDVITNASIDRIRTIFAGYPLIEDNLLRGELIVKVLGMAILVSPYIKAYNFDGTPIYTDSIIEDLARRDFSMNAIAYSPDDGTVDPFGGADGLGKDIGVVSAIGEEQYSSEWELPAGLTSAFLRSPANILRAVGYVSSGDFTVSEPTNAAIIRNSALVLQIPADYLRTELSWVLWGRRITQVLHDYSGIFELIIPELARLFGFNQYSPRHDDDLWTHTIKAIGCSAPKLNLRYALLFHALGKPDCFAMGMGGEATYDGHAERGAILTRRIMTRMGFAESNIREVEFLVKYHDLEPGLDKKSLKYTLRNISPEKLKLLLLFKYADLKATSPELEPRANLYKSLTTVVDEIVLNDECYSMQQLAISAHDLLKRGIVREIDKANRLTERLLALVMDNPSYNTPARLIDIATKSVGAAKKA